MATVSDAMLKQLVDGITSLQASSERQAAFNANLQKQLDDTTRDVKTAIDRLEQGNKEVFARMNQLEHETQQKISQVATDLRAWVEGKIDQKIADDHHSKRFCAAPSTSASSGAPPGAHPRTPHTAETQDDDCTILVGGFPRELPKPALAAHFSAIRAAVPVSMMEGAVLQAGHGKKAYGIKFPTRAAAIRFSAHTRDNSLVLSWADPLDGKAAEGMWARAPRTVQENEVGKIFSAGWTLLQNRLMVSDVWTTNGYKLQTDRKKSRIAAHNDVDFKVLVSLDGEEREVNMMLQELADFGIQSTEAEEIRAHLVRAVRASRPAAA